MPQREQPEAGRELSLGPPSQLPTVVGQMAGPSRVVDDQNVGSQGYTLPLPSPSGSIEPPVYPQIPQSPNIDRAPPVSLPEPVSVGPTPVVSVPEAIAPERPTTQNPFQPSGRDHKAEEYGPSFWSQPWQQRMP